MPIITKKMGLVAGRHDMPVDGYVFDDIQDVLDIGELEATADFCIRNIFVDSGLGYVRNADCDARDYYRYGSLTLYVTGLTAALAAVINACQRYGVNLTLMHYNRDTGHYVPQSIWSRFAER